MEFPKEDIEVNPEVRENLSAVSIGFGHISCKFEDVPNRILKGIISKYFKIGGYTWSLSMSLFAVNTNGPPEYLSIYLHAIDSTDLPLGWSTLVSFRLALVDQFQVKLSVKKEPIDCCFKQDSKCFGFSNFLSLADLCNSNRGFVVDDSIIVEVLLEVKNVVYDLPNDSKRQTGFVGLKNQGATCYLNSLIQILYHLPCFRKTVYHVPTSEDDLVTESIPRALQSLFYELQYSDSSPGTEDLTKSFGWDSSRCSREEDAHETNMLLFQKLEEKMEGSPVDGAIQKLFEGHVNNYIECVGVDFKSNHTESFYDLQLDVKGCKDVYESFGKYVREEKLEGENQYMANEHGLQDARKGAKFIDFPPVLRLQLKRFEFDLNQDKVVKISDRCEFPLQLDLDRENGKYLSLGADRSVRNLYTLHSFLVHSGDNVESGHYYAYIRPRLCDRWYKFNDHRVTQEDSKTVLEAHCGADVDQNHPTAYMLFYVRESHKDMVICDVEQEDIPQHVRGRLEEEEEEAESKTKKTDVNDDCDDDKKQEN